MIIIYNYYFSYIVVICHTLMYTLIHSFISGKQLHSQVVCTVLQVSSDHSSSSFRCDLKACEVQAR